LKDELGEKVVECLGEFVGHRPNANHYFLAKALEEGNWVFTTNQDDLIEKACDELDIDIRTKSCVTKEDYEQFNKIVKSAPTPQDVPRGYLFKIHGNLEVSNKNLDMYKTILMTLREVGRSFNEYKTNVLTYYLENFDFCFMGYSCMDDFSIYPILKSTHSDKSILWFEFRDDSIGEIIWTKRRFEEEIEIENLKSTWDKNWGKINVNNVLLERNVSVKLLGDSSEFIKRYIYKSIDQNLLAKLLADGNESQSPRYEGLLQWANCIGLYNREIALGRLWEACWDGKEAIKYFKEASVEAERSGQLFKKAIAMKMIARVYEKQCGEERKALKYYDNSFSILNEIKSVESDLESAHINIERANLLRRVYKDFPNSKILIEESIRMLEPKNGDKNESCQLAYARALNILGLIYYQSNEDINIAKELCEKSLKIKKECGDIDGIAESKNALGLISDKMANYEDAIKNYYEAIKYRERIGNYRGIGQQYRNLGLCYEKLRDNKLAKQSYEKGKINWYRIRNGNPPIRELLDFQLLLGGLNIRMGNENEAVNELETAAKKWQDMGEWHNRARCLNLLLDCYANLDTEKLKYTSLDIISIYKDVINDEKKLKEIRNAKIKYINAKDFLNRVKATLDKAFPDAITLELEYKEAIDKILEDLRLRFE
jgi:tetratricopeptide (TPR) repeat protein